MNNNTHHHAALYHCSLAIAAVAMAITMNSCQDYEYGFTEEEIAYSATIRHYNDEFIQMFGKPDPTHTWMCEPTTITSNTANTRAGMGLEDITVTPQDKPLSLQYAQVDAALDFMREGGDYRVDSAKCTQNFEFLAVEETTYDIYPTFWGRKFCDYNEVGVYYMDGDTKHDLPAFWDDKNNKIKVVLTDDNTISITNSETELTTLINNAIPNCSTCGGDGMVGEHRCNGTIKNNKCEICGTTYDRWSRPNQCTAMVGGTHCASCHGSGKASVDHIEFPHYQVTIPTGVKWGLYLRTKQQQTTNSNRIKWYSNAKYNDGESPAAAMFSHGGINYVSFEDAPMACTNHQGTGTCGVCNHGHYDHDYNDIVLTIAPRPIASTYDYKAVRVMCEDLGGTFDWDFNDLVYDLKYEEGAQEGQNATITITLQAIGGTLPIHFVYKGEDLGELHSKFAKQTAVDGLYEPVLTALNKEIKKVKLNFQKKPEGYDFREIVRDIQLVVADVYYSTRAGDDVEIVESHTINFPIEGGGGKVPQCFMADIGTQWPDELQNINDRYPTFAGWVQNQSTNSDWWKSDPNY